VPTSTFDRLAPERKAQFIEAAFDEFLKHDYQHASVTQIVNALGIGKGSAYRYFASKKELYFYLAELAQQRKMAYVMPVLQQSHLDFFVMYRQLYRAGLTFMAEAPRYSQFLYNMSQERNSEALGDLMMDNKRRGIEAFLPQLEAQRAQGHLRTDVPLDMLAFAIVQLGTGLSEYILMNYRSDMEAVIRGEQDQITSLTEQKMTEIIDAFMSMLEHGVRSYP
jgi:AcrR family transcriptional regulator